MNGFNQGRTFQFCKLFRQLQAGMLAGCLLGLSSLGWAGDALPRLMGLQPDTSGQGLVLKVENGGFDPILQLESDPDVYRILIEGESVVFSSRLPRQAEKLLAELAKTLPSMQSLRLQTLRSTDGEPGIRLILESSIPLYPHILANDGREIRISLSGESLNASSEAENAEESIISNTGATAMAMIVSAPLPGYESLPSESLYLRMKTSSEPIQSAFSRIRAGQLEEAEQTLQAYLSRSPDAEDQAWAQLLLGLVAQEHQDNHEAGRIWRSLIEKHRNFRPAYHKLIALHLESRAYTDAELLLSLALNNWPQDATLNYQQGLLAEIKNRPDDAMQAYTRALQLQPDNPAYHYRLALVELKRKNFGAARYELNRALTLSPDDPRLHKMLGYVHTLEKNPEMALGAYSRALNPDVMINYARLLAAQDKTSQAVAIYEAVEAIAPDNPDLLFNLGMLYSEIHQKAGAERTLRRFVTMRQGKKDSRIQKAEATLRKLASQR